MISKRPKKKHMNTSTEQKMKMDHIQELSVCAVSGL